MPIDVLTAGRMAMSQKERDVLITRTDDATSYRMARFYPSGTVEAPRDLVERRLRRHGRPLALYSDRHSIFEPHDQGKALPGAQAQFGRALRALGIELIRAHSPQAKGCVERSFGTAQDRWVKELRLAKATTVAQANAVLERLLPVHNRRRRQCGGRRGPDPRGGGAGPWRTAVRRALGSHPCGALSSRRRRGR
jgi:hypothetical protein